MTPEEAPLSDPNLLTGYLQQCHQRLKEVTQGSFFSLKKFTARYPAYSYDLVADDAMHRFFQAQKQLFKEGKPVWGFIVSAQDILWQSDKECGLGILMHPADPDVPIHPDALTYAAKVLWHALEQPEEYPDCENFIAKLHAGHQRMFGQAVPRAIFPSCQLALTHVCIDKKKLRYQPFDQHPFPALFLQEPTAAALFPFWTWPVAMFHSWQKAS